MSYVKGVCEREKSSLVLLKLPGGNRSQLLLLPPAPQLVSDKLVSAFLSQLVRYLRVFTQTVFRLLSTAQTMRTRATRPSYTGQCLGQRDLGVGCAQAALLTPDGFVGQ